MVDTTTAAPELTLSEQPQTHIDASAFSRPMRVSIAPGLEQLGAGLEADADTAAKQQAATDVQQAVTRNANGDLVVATPQNSFILGQAGQDYHEAMVQGLRAQVTSNVSNDIAAARTQFPTDPVAFKAAADGVADKYRQLYPGVVGNSLATQAQNEGGQYHTNMVEQLATKHVQESLQAITTTIDDTNSKLRVLARQGAINTPEYDQLSDQLQDSYDALGSNKLFGYSQEKIDSEQAHAFSMLNGEYVVGRIDDTFTRKGKNAALEAIRTGIDNNPDLNLSDPERNQLKTYALSRLAYLSDQQQTAVAALKPLSDLQVKAYQAGNNGPDRVSDREFEQTFTQLQSLGAFKEASELQNARIISDRMSAVRNLPPDQKAAALFQLVTSGAATAAGGYLGALKQQENNTGNPMAGNGGGDYQFTPGTWTALAAKHPELNLSAGGRTDPAQQSRAIVAFTNDNKAALSAAGIQPTDANTYMAHFLGAGGATSFIKAMQANPGAPAAAGNLAAATANPSIFYKNSDPSQPRSYSEVYALQTRRFGGGTTPVVAAGGSPQQPFTDAEAAANPGLRLAWRQQLQVDDATQVKYAKAQFETLDNAIKFAGAPSPAMLGSAATALQIADSHPDQLGAQADKLRGALAGQPAGFAAAGSPGGGATMLAQAEDMVRQSPGSRLALSLGEGVKAGIEQGKQLLASDSFEYAHRAEWIQQKPPPIDFTTPDTAAALPQAMQARAVAATAVAQHTGVAGTSALSPSDLPQIKSVMTSGTLDQRMAVLGSIANAGMSEPVLRATLSQLAGAKETLPLAVAGSLVRQQQPEAARGILQGQQAMLVEPKLAPNKDDFPSELAKVIPFNDLAAGPAREGIDGAVQAYYAKLSADAGDTTGVLNADRVSKAADAVTGGVFGYRGAKAIAPWYGASQADSDAAIRSLGDADFVGAHTADGSPFPASALKPSFSSAFTFQGWRLQSYGDGKYLVFSGADTARQYLSDRNNGKFILDLGAKRADVERAATHFKARSIYQLLPGEAAYPYGSSLDSAGAAAR